MSSGESGEGDPVSVAVAGSAVGCTFLFGLFFGAVAGHPVVGFALVVSSCCAFVIFAVLVRPMDDVGGEPCIVVLNYWSVTSFCVLASVAAVVLGILGILGIVDSPEEGPPVVFHVMVIVAVVAVLVLHECFMPPYCLDGAMRAKQDVCTAAAVLVPTGSLLFVQFPSIGGVLFACALPVFFVWSWEAGITWWFWVRVKVRAGRFRDPLQFVPAVVVVVGGVVADPGTDDPSADLAVIDRPIVAFGPGGVENVPTCTYLLLHGRGLRARASRRDAEIERRSLDLDGWTVLS